MPRKKGFTKVLPIYITPEQDAWLEQQAEAQHTTKVDIVRQAINQLRKQSEKAKESK